METLLLIIGLFAVALLIRRTSSPRMVYVPLELAEERGGLGCLPLLVVGVLALLVLLMLGGWLN